MSPTVSPTVTAKCWTCGENADHQPQELARIWAEHHVQQQGHDAHAVALSTTTVETVVRR